MIVSPTMIVECMIPLMVLSVVVGGITGRVLALVFVARFKRASALILSLVLVLVFSLFIYLAYFIDSRRDFAFTSLCEA